MFVKVERQIEDRVLRAIHLLGSQEAANRVLTHAAQLTAQKEFWLDPRYAKRTVIKKKPTQTLGNGAQQQ